MRRPTSALAIAAASLVAAACALTAGSDEPGSAGAKDGVPGASSSGGAFDPSTPDGSKPGPSTTCKPSALNVEVPGNGCDDDADGKVDVVASCDDGIAVDGAAEQFARALGLCKAASSSSWGLVSARYTNGFTRSDAPAEGQHGILDSFGAVVQPREGARLGVLSTGWAREYNAAGAAQHVAFNTQPQYAMQRSPIAGFPTILDSTPGEPPPGWPKAAAGCPALSDKTFDSAAIELVVKVPANAKGLRFDFDFYSGEWPQWVCSRFNDGFVAMLSSKANASGGWENISFDARGNPVSVNFAFFDRCSPNVKTSCKESAPATSLCPGGTSELLGTGFAVADDYCGYGTVSTGGGATGWLVSKAPVQPGETIKLKLMIWDTGDFKYDSSVLVDHLTWIPADDPAPAAPKTERAPDIVR